MTRARLSVMLMVLLLAGVATPCDAQSELPVVYVQVAPTVTIHAEGEQYMRASPPLKGTTFGGALAVGARFSPEVGAEASITVDGTQSDAQADIYSGRTDYTAESRDLLLDVNLRFRPRGGSRIEFTVGGGWAYTRFARRDVVFSSPISGQTFPGVDVETSQWEPTVTGAMAVAVPLSPRVELMPSIGVRWLRRPFDTDAWYFGVGRYSVLSTVALRLPR